MRHYFRAAILCLPLLAVAPTSSVATAQGGAAPLGAADRLVNDPRVDALRPYGLALPPAVRADKGVQFGKALRFKLSGHADFWRIGVTTPTTRAIRKGDRIVVAFWARATGTDMNLPGRIGRVQLEETPVVRALVEKPFEIGPEWKMYQMSGRVDRDYAPGQLNAALHVDAAKQVLDIGPVFVLDYGQDAS
ncbi:hypothetical protein ASG29_03660 [Sphingomonas sp. Leaf412]|uniref:hypothetical protein n=1 Tax=Sphingomonas sp. Leaf412 TaxID=1736370 RepID=UPI0006F6539A|nr:hypothetical protein [Sphingomonas sp. Leaf412]KQT35218.1 hypothetical protein ASG29_03660 [Sphingomonas sp. Leaf412]